MTTPVAIIQSSPLPNVAASSIVPAPVLPSPYTASSFTGLVSPYPIYASTGQGVAPRGSVVGTQSVMYPKGTGTFGTIGFPI